MLANRSIVSAIAVSMACAPSRSGLPPVTTVPPNPAADTGATPSAKEFAFLPGHFEYGLAQTSRVHALGSADSISGTVLITARLIMDVARINDSIYEVSASIDSLQTVTGGSIPSRLGAHPHHWSLGPVLRAWLGPDGSRVESSLADSLCAFGQLVSLARDLLLPQLPSRVLAPVHSVKTDTARIAACRAGSQLELLVTRQISSPGAEPPQVNLQGTTEVKGGGTLGRDSVRISGSVTTRGVASLTGGSRLPSFLQTQSEGFITVQLGDSTTVFRQTSTQHLEQRSAPTQPTTVPPN
jgi:hypothetical protein